MINDVTYCLMQVFFVIYIYIVVNRICNCFEQCSLNKSMGEAYKNLDANMLHTMLRSKKES